MLVKKYEPKALLAKAREQSLLADLGNLLIQAIYLLCWGLWAHESAVCSLDEWKIGFKNRVFYKRYELTYQDRKEANRLTLVVYEALLEAGIFEDRSPNKRLYSAIYDRFYKWALLPQVLVRVSSKPELQKYLFIKIQFTPQELAKLPSDRFLTQISQALATSSGKFVALAPILDEKGWLTFALQSTSYNPQLSIFDELKAPSRKLVIRLDREHIWDMSHAYSGLISGASGTGKTSFLFSLMAAAAFQKIRLFVIDGKASQLGSIANMYLPPERVAIDAKGAVAVIHYLLSVSKARYHYLSGVRKDAPEKIFESVTDEHVPPILLIFDEMAAITQALSKKERDRFLKELQTLSQIGRESQIFLLIAMQNANAMDIPTSIREQLSGLKVILGTQSQITSQMKQMVFGAAVELPPSPFSGGGCGYIWTEGTEGPTAFKAPLLPHKPADMAKFMKQALGDQKDLGLA